MLLLHITRGNTGRCWRWRLRMILQGMNRSHLRHSVLIDGIGMRVMIGIMTRVGRVMSMQW